MLFGIYLIKNFFYFSFFVNNKCSSQYPHVRSSVHRFFSPHSISFQDFLPGISNQIKTKTEPKHMICFVISRKIYEGLISPECLEITIILQMDRTWPWFGLYKRYTDSVPADSRACAARSILPMPAGIQDYQTHG